MLCHLKKVCVCVCVVCVCVYENISINVNEKCIYIYVYVKSYHIIIFQYIDLYPISQNKKSMTKLTKKSVTLFVSSRQAPDLHASRAPVQGHVHELPLSP